ncbi:pectinesterase-like [Solanum lycopersicum]|uniref:Pectinesterase n=1 Tax=Solanum lycopersicum TaxID=4081 RepID=A0A3Q7GME6_SOLLC|nr:pectinesterase-like [Solanum lycopersicum]
MGVNKVAIGSIASLLLVACVVAAAISTTSKRNEDNSSNNNNDSQISTSAKSVNVICQQTDYKETCVKSLAKANNTNDPKDLLKVAFGATINDLFDVIKNSALLINEASKDPRTKDALKTCGDLLDVAIDDVRRSFDEIGVFDATKFKDYADDLKTWLSASITYQETCLDAFENTTGETGEKMRKLLKNAGELTSNSLAMVSSFGQVLTDLNLKIPGVNRRLLNAHERMLNEVNSNGLKPNVVVAIDGSGQYKSINEALRAVPKKNTQKFVIFIKAGIYKEYIDIPKKMNHIVFIGEGPTKTKITGNKNFADGIGTFQTATVAINGDNFMAKDIGIENTAGAIKHQAVALRVSGDKAIFHNCQFDGYQDTLYVHAYRQFFRDCTITGTIDFIFGDASSVFQSCKMIVRKPMANQACMVTAQGRKDRRGVGAIVMQNCEIRAEHEFISTQPTIKAYLGRPWKEFSRTIIMQSLIDGFIDPQGWSVWAGDFALHTLFYAEYENRGIGANSNNRVNWRGYKKNIGKEIAAGFAPGVFILADEWVRLSGVPYESGLMKV